MDGKRITLTFGYYETEDEAKAVVERELPKITEYRNSLNLKKMD